MLQEAIYINIMHNLIKPHTTGTIYLNGQKATASWNRSLSFPCRYVLGLSLCPQTRLIISTQWAKAIFWHCCERLGKITVIWRHIRKLMEMPVLSSYRHGIWMGPHQNFGYLAFSLPKHSSQGYSRITLGNTQFQSICLHLTLRWDWL